jgi:hypothetical protein
MYKLNLMVLALLCILSVVAATPRGLKQAKIRRAAEHGNGEQQPQWGNKHKASKG